MGNTCFKSKKNKNNLEDHLIRYMFCEKCQELYLSSYEYNRHIYKCNQRYNLNNNKI